MMVGVKLKNATMLRAVAWPVILPGPHAYAESGHRGPDKRDHLTSPDECERLHSRRSNSSHEAPLMGPCYWMLLHKG